jgi:hypothetical protein
MKSNGGLSPFCPPFSKLKAAPENRLGAPIEYSLVSATMTSAGTKSPGGARSIPSPVHHHRPARVELNLYSRIRKHGSKFLTGFGMLVPNITSFSWR